MGCLPRLSETAGRSGKNRQTDAAGFSQTRRRGDPPGILRRTTGQSNKERLMKATQQLHNLGQSIWLDNITRDLLDSGTLGKYIEELSVTGLTSNPTIFDHAIRNSADYDGDIARNASHTNA